MSGQGRPHIRPSQLRLARTNLSRLSSLALAALVVCAGAAHGEDVDIRVRVAWGGGDARAWQGTIRLSQGALSDATPLGLEADAPGSLQPESADTIRIHRRTPRTYDGCDLHVQAPAEAALIVSLSAEAGGDAPPLEIPVSRLLKGFVQFDLDTQRNRLLAQRSPGDALRVNFARESLLFSPGERFELEVRPNQLELSPGSSYILTAALGPARSDDQTWTEEREVRVSAAGEAPGMELTVPIPDAEGVYDLTLSLQPKRLTSALPLFQGKALATRDVQLVVVSPVKLIGPPPAAWQSVLEFDPATPKWWERVAVLPTWTRLPTQPQPVGSAAPLARTHLNRSWVELAPEAWQAYPLSVAATGAPHILEVEFPSDLEQTLAISILEPNAAGQVGPIGVDSGLDVLPPAPGHKPQTKKHRMTFWPQTRAPYVLLVNRRTNTPAIFGKLNVLAGPATLAPLKIMPPNYAARTLAAYYDKPLVAENFSASEAVDPISKRGLDDWVTFLEAGNRLVQSLQTGGYNAVVLTVACEGSAIYPSQLLAPTPKYDSGVFFESGQDPVRKDVLELLFRLCDRSGIQLVPAVQFAAPLPALEAIRLAGGPAANGLEPLGADGQTWIGRQGAQGGMGVYYNALDPRVQSSMTAVVGELAERYAHHASFGGVAVQLSTAGYSLLPDETCSYDGVTVQRFLNEKKVLLPVDEEPSLASLDRFLKTKGAKSWREWRSDKVTELYLGMRDEVTRRRPNARLFCTTADLFGGRHLRQALRPTLPENEQFEDLLSGCGLAVARLAREGIIVPRPQRIVPAVSPTVRSLDRHWNSLAGLDAIFAPGGRGTGIHFLTPAPLRLPAFDAVSPFGADRTQTLLLSQLVPADSAQRERFVTSLAALDAPLILEGGWLLPQGQDAALAPLIKVFRRLPADAFQTVKLPGQPRDLVVRTLTKNARTYFYALNPYPWPTTAEMEFRAAEPMRLASFSDDRKTSLQQRNGGIAWKVELEPFDLIGGELSSGRAQVAGWKLTPPVDAAKEIGERLRQVAVRVGSFGERTPLSVLANPSFEQPAAEGWIPGWLAARGEGMFAGVDPLQGHTGTSSLHLVSARTMQGAAPNVWVRSDRFPAPTTGRISVFAWIRVANPAQQPRLRMAIEGKLDGQVYYKLAKVGQGEPGMSVPLTNQWVEYHIPFTDLPVAGLTDFCVGFDLMGEGEVWIDDVQIVESWFESTGKEHAELVKSTFTATQQLSQGELGECWRYLDGYWPEFLRQHVPLSSGGRPAPGADGLPMGEGPLTSRPAAGNPPAENRPAAAAPPRAAEQKSWWQSWMKWR